MIGCILGFVLVPEAEAGLPKPADIKTLRSRLAASRRALEKPRADLDEEDRKQLLAKLTATDQALTRFVDLSNQHAKKNGLAPLYALEGALVLDDATGVGTLDDPLIPIVGLAILVTEFVAMKQPSTPELEAAWGDVTARIQELSEAARSVSARRPKKPGCYCRCFTRGIGPYPHARVENEAICYDFCRSNNYQGYQCGGEVIWF